MKKLITFSMVLWLVMGGALAWAQEPTDTPATTYEPGAFTKTSEDNAQLKRAKKLLQIAWRGDMTPWREELDKIVANPKAHLEVLYTVAVQLRLLKTHNTSTPIFERILKILDSRAKSAGNEIPDKILMIRGISQMALGKISEGIATIDQINATETRSWNFDLCQIAHGIRNLSGLGTVEQIQGLLDRLTPRLPKCHDAILEAKADDLFARGNADDAVVILEKLLGSPNTNQPELIDRIAGFYIRTKRPRKAVAMLRKLCNTGECDARLRGNIVWAQSQYHREPNVIENTMKAAEAAPDDHLLQFEAGVMHHYALKFHLSKRFLDRALKKWPDDPRILLYAAMNYYRSGQQDKAIVAIDHAVKTASSRDPDLYYCRGVIYRNVDLKVALDNMTHYQKLMWNRKDSPFKKRGMVMAFIDGMSAELKRREGGAKPRYFADPEEDHFGEPPGSLGRSPDAIHTSNDTEAKLEVLRKMREVSDPPAPGETSPPPVEANKKPPAATTPPQKVPASPQETEKSGLTTMIVGFSSVVGLALFLVFLRRRKRGKKSG